MKKIYLFFLITTIIVTGMTMWFSSIHNHNNDIGVTLLACILLSAIFCFFTNIQLVISALIATIGTTIAIIIKFFIDWHYDPTSHNLFPFELAIDMFLIFVTTVIGSCIGFLLRKLKKNPERFNNNN